MSKFYGDVGYVMTVEDECGNWVEETVVRKTYGDILTSSHRYENGTGSNDNLVMSVRLSIVADTFAKENFSMIKWVEHMGVKWKVTNIEVLYPRLILSFGGRYADTD